MITRKFGLFVLFTISVVVIGADDLYSQPQTHAFGWAKGLRRRSVLFDCSDPWTCFAAATTITRGNVTVYDVLQLGLVSYPYDAVGSVISKPKAGHPCGQLVALKTGAGVICIETRESFPEIPVVWTTRNQSEFQRSEPSCGSRSIWGKDDQGQLARVCFSSHRSGDEIRDVLLYSEFRADGELLDKKVPLEGVKARFPLTFGQFWWADAFTILSNGNLLFVNSRVGPTHSEIDSSGRVGRDSVEVRLGYFLIDVNHPEKSSFGTADLDKASMGSFPASMGRQAECLKNSQGEIWFLVETQGYRDPSDRMGFRDASVTSLTLVSFVVEGDTVSLGSVSHPKLTPSTRIDYPIHRIVCVDGEGTVDGIKIIDIGKDGAIFIDQF